MGTLPGSTREWDTKIDGSGIIKALVRGNILETWSYWGKFEYDDSNGGGFKELNNPDLAINTAVILKTELPVFKEKNMSQISFIAKIGEKGTITKTDNKLWCLFESESGMKGWFPVVKFSVILHINKRASAVFDGLHFAD